MYNDALDRLCVGRLVVRIAQPNGEEPPPGFETIVFDDGRLLSDPELDMMQYSPNDLEPQRSVFGLSASNDSVGGMGVLSIELHEELMIKQSNLGHMWWLHEEIPTFLD